MKKRNWKTACMALLAVSAIAAAYVSATPNMQLNLESTTALAANDAENALSSSKTKTVTLSETHEKTDLLSISGYDTLTVAFASTRGPRLVQVSIYQGESSAPQNSATLGVQGSYVFSLDPTESYVLKASLPSDKDYGSGGSVTFQLTYSKTSQKPLEEEQVS